MVKGFNSPVLAHNRSSRKKITKNMEDFSNMLNMVNLIDAYQTLNLEGRAKTSF